MSSKHRKKNKRILVGKGTKWLVRKHKIARKYLIACLKMILKQPKINRKIIVFL